MGKIYAKLEETQSGNSHSVVPKYNSQLEEIKPLTQDEVRKLLLKFPSKAYKLDTIPTWFLKLCLDEQLPLITRIVNMSFHTAEMPDEYKLAILIPLLKKMGLQLIFKNYRPISYLSFVSKLIERGAIFQLVEHMKSQNLFEKVQSAYSEGRNTETALLRIQNDILMAMECKQVTALIMLYLSSAFDTVNHKDLLQRLEKRVGITGKALPWFTSYLSNRSQSVRIGDSRSRPPTILKCGVPQGSPLGPFLFIVYTLPIGDIICSHGLSFHIYVDDNDNYISFKLEDCDQNLVKLRNCIADLRI